ncbi:sulfatase-like hydrolase/transferase, partial [Bacillus pacificus]|nr:sulfatase-like hydrolase/transferase [Bacillus pacificus]
PGMDDSEWQQLKATYYGMMAEVDDQLGRLMAFLRQQGVLEQTLVIFTSDHGEQLGDHYLLDKQGFYDSSYHIPLIMRLPPGMAVAGRQVHAFTEQVDLLPTVLGLLGGEVPLQADGYSLQPWLQAVPPAQWRRFVHWEHDFRDVPEGKPEALLGLNMDECSL